MNFGNFFYNLFANEQEDDSLVVSSETSSTTTAATLLANNNNVPADILTKEKQQQIISLAQYLHKPRRIKHSNYKKIVESTRQVSEVAIWSDRRCPELLSLFIEVELHQCLLQLLTKTQQNSTNQAVAIQVLQTLSIILDGITETKFLYSLFSNNFVNQLIAAPLDLDNNEEILAYYVAFLKALSLKLNPDTIHFFFNERMDDFPLYTTAISLFDHPDSMVRVAVRAITLNVFRVNDPEVLEFVLSAPSVSYFWSQIMQALKESGDDAFRILIDMTATEATTMVATTVIDTQRMTETQEWAALDQVLENHMGLLAYLNDIYGLGVERINRRVTEEFLDRILTRIYAHAIEIGWRAEATPEETLFMQCTTLFISQFFSILRHPPLLVDVLSALFAKRSDDEEQEEEEEEGAALSDHYAGDHIPRHMKSRGRSHSHHVQSPKRISDAIGPLLGEEKGKNKDTVKSLPPRQQQSKKARLSHPFIPSPYESSRTLVPWLLLVLDILSNKAISPTTLVKSVLVPRRMLRTLSLLTSLTGGRQRQTNKVLSLTRGGTSSSSSSSLSSNSEDTSIVQSMTAKIDPLPQPTQTIVTAMVQILTQDFALPTHTWITVYLASLVLTQLTKVSSAALSVIRLDQGMFEELQQAQCTRAAVMQATLLDGTLTAGLWKTLVKCLVEFANADSETLCNKVESECRYIFGSQHQQPASDPSSPPRSSSTSSATATALNNQEYDTSSPFDRAGLDEMGLLANLYQVHHLNRLLDQASANIPSTESNKNNSYRTDLRNWLGTSIATTGDIQEQLLSATVIDNGGAKSALLPRRGITRLGFDAQVTCQNGCLVIVTSSNDNNDIQLVWPLADTIAKQILEHTDAADLPTIQLSDTSFPAWFFPPLPHSMGGIHPSALLPPRNNQYIAGNAGKKLNYAYFDQRPQRSLDISLRFKSPEICTSVMELIKTHVVVSRRSLADIYLKHKII